MESQLLLPCSSGTKLRARDHFARISNVDRQSIVCIVAIMFCKQIGVIKNLAPFDTTKAKKCAYTDILYPISYIRFLAPPFKLHFVLLTAARVPCLPASRGHDLHQHQGPPIPIRPGLHHL